MLTSVLVYFFQQNPLFKAAALCGLFRANLLQLIQSVTARKSRCMYHFEQIRKFLDILVLMILGQFFIKLGIYKLQILFI